MAPLKRSDFASYEEYQKAWKLANREEQNAKAKERMKRDRPVIRKKRAAKAKKENNAVYARNKAKYQDRRLRLKYGITLDQYEDMFEGQGGACFICEALPTERRKLAVDHCHTTGRVRALLCHTCNNHLGIYEKYRDRFEDYLRRV